MIKKRTTRALISILMLILWTSCSRHELSSELTFSGERWHKFDHKQVMVDIPPLEQPAAVVLHYELSPGFPESYFAFQLQMDDMQGDERYRNFNLRVKDKQAQFTGRQQGSYYVYEDTLIAGKYFNREGAYRFTLVNLMPKLNTTGIHRAKLIIRY